MTLQERNALLLAAGINTDAPGIEAALRTLAAEAEIEALEWVLGELPGGCSTDPQVLADRIRAEIERRKRAKA